ncbi:hypothetical protein [Streptomyces sp. WMMC905]|uniref:hypothetical protein n=1 Tax=Streptomyces sp. WMMC905 TaxID=3404123 RepID=UPI003B9326DB
MADERNPWPEDGTDGSPPEEGDAGALGAVSPERAARLAEILVGLTPRLPEVEGEYPGEAAAVAAFRDARRAPRPGNARPADPGADSASEAPASPGADIVLRHPDRRQDLGRDGGDVRVRRPRARLRRVAAAALAVGLVGGGGAVAGTGVLRAPLTGDHPIPEISATGAATPEPPVSPRAESTGLGSVPVATAEETGPGHRGAGGTADGPPALTESGSPTPASPTPAGRESATDRRGEEGRGDRSRSAQDDGNDSRTPRDASAAECLGVTTPPGTEGARGRTSDGPDADAGRSEDVCRRDSEPGSDIDAMGLRRAAGGSGWASTPPP